MTPGKITSTMTYTVHLSLVSDDKAISMEAARTTTRKYIEDVLQKRMDDVPGDFTVEVIARSHYTYDLRGAPPLASPAGHPQG